MNEQLLTLRQTANLLGISERNFHRKKNALIAKGLKRVKIGRRTNFVASSLDKMILKAAETENPLC